MLRIAVLVDSRRVIGVTRSIHCIADIEECDGSECLWFGLDALWKADNTYDPLATKSRRSYGGSHYPVAGASAY